MRTKRSFWFGFLIILLFALGCSAGQEQADSASVATEAAGAAPGSAGGDQAADGSAPQRMALPRKIIYRGNVSLATENLDKAAEQLESLIRQYNGYIARSARIGNRGATRSGEWTVRVPSENFDPFVKALPDLGELENSDQQADDVSEEFYDVQARLRNKKVEEQRLIELLQKATGKLQEVLTVEKELTRVREEIERIEGRLRFLTNQTDHSTVTIRIREVERFEPAGPPSLATKVGRAFTESTTTLKDFGTAMLLFVVVLLPWLLPIGLAALIVRRLAKGRRRNR